MMMVGHLRRLGPHLALVGILLLATVSVFSRVVFGDGLMSFRDTLNFYFPVFQYQTEEWGQGRLPLWNPYSSCGEPFLATGTSSVLYPGKLIFALPLNFVARFHLYVILHVVLAGWACGLLARSWGASFAAATLAALSYCLSGTVVFQYSNVVFLCGAAWFPLALYFGSRLVDSRKFRDAAGLATTLAMMLLAGDPQMSYQVGGLVAILALMDFLKAGRNSESAPQNSIARDRHWYSRFAGGRLFWLLVAAVLAAGLSAVQILPSAELLALSERGTPPAPRSLYEIPGFLLTDAKERARHNDGTPAQWYDTIIGNPPGSRHDATAYATSIEPWRLVELVLPGFSGNTFGRDTRWPVGLGWQRQIWNPSLYLGVIPFLFAVAAFRPRHANLRYQWILLSGIIAGVASFGCYGPMYLAQLTTGASDTEQLASGGVGGVFWFMRLTLPGFAGFRFPAKLFTIATLAISLLAAAGMDRWLQGPIKRLTRFGAGLLVLCAVFAFAAWIGQDSIARSIEHHALTRLGTLDAEASSKMILWSAIHAAFVLTLFLLLDFLVRRSHRDCQSSDSSEDASMKRTKLIALIAVAITGGDVIVASHQQIGVIPRDQWLAEPQVVRSIDEHNGRTRGDDVEQPQSKVSHNTTPARVFRPPAWDTPIATDVAADIDLQQEQWHRQTLYYKQNLMHRIVQVYDYGTTPIDRYQNLFNPLFLNEQQVYIQPRRMIDLWGADYFVMPSYNDSKNYDRTVVTLKTRWPKPGTGLDHPFLPFGPELDIISPQTVAPEVGAGEPVASTDGARVEPMDWEVRYNDGATRDCWIVHSLRILEPMANGGRPPQNVYDIFAYPSENPIDFRKVAVVEDGALADEWGVGVQNIAKESVATPSTCAITEFSPNALVIDADLSEDGFLVLAHQWYPGWQATVESDGGASQALPIYKTNLAMRGVFLTAGHHRVTFHYWPWRFYLGAIITSVTVCVLIGAIFLRRRRSHLATATASA